MPPLLKNNSHTYMQVSVFLQFEINAWRGSWFHKMQINLQQEKREFKNIFSTSLFNIIFWPNIVILDADSILRDWGKKDGWITAILCVKDKSKYPSTLWCLAGSASTSSLCDKLLKSAHLWTTLHFFSSALSIMGLLGEID